jgi:GNAT superfamily N-acetyltransferase
MDVKDNRSKPALQFAIRPLQKNDMKQVVTLLKENMSAFEPDMAEYEAIWTRYNSQQNMHGFVAVVDGVIAGYASIFIEIKIRGGHVGHIEDIVTTAAHRRQGIGTKLLQTLLQVAKETSCYKVSGAIQPYNMKFYNSAGYRADGISISQMVEK